MSNYTKSILDLSSQTVEGVDKVLKRYLKSASAHEEFQEFYNRQVDYISQGKRLPWDESDYKKAFKAKNFFNDYRDCGSYVEFRHYKKSDVLKLHNANFCKRDKICAPCAVRRAYKQQLKFMSIIQDDKKFLSKDWYYIVIPVKHNKSESYTTVMNRVISMRKKITKSMRNSRSGNSTNFWSNFDGGMYSQEVTYSSNGWNVHLNLILNAPRPIDGGGYSENNPKPSSVRGEFYIKSIKNRRGQISYQNEDLKSWLLRNFDSYIHNISKIEDNTKLNDEIVEVLKYSLKFSALTDMQLFEVFVKSIGVRMFGTFGNLWGKGLEEVTLEGDDVLSEEFEELIFLRTFDDFYQYNYRMYKREINKNDEAKILLDHTFGVCLKNLSQYNKDPMMFIPLGDCKMHIQYKGRKDA